MMKTLHRIVIGLLVFLLAMPRASGQSTEYELAQIVNQRQPLMLDLQTAYLTLLNVQNGKSMDYSGAAGAARSMSETMERFLLLMKPGTARGEAPGSRTKPEVWSEADAFAEAAQGFRAQAISFAEVAERGNKDEYAREFEAFTAACTSCHGLRPSSGGRFRYATNE